MKHLSGIKPNEVVFLTIQERCLVPAKEMGMKVILVNGPTQAVAEVQKLTEV